METRIDKRLLIGLLIITIGLTAGCFTSTLEDTVEETTTLNLHADAYADQDDGDHDKIVIEVIGGKVDWLDCEVSVNGEQWHTSSIISWAGDEVTFYDDILGTEADADPGFDVGEEINIKIVELGDNEVVWEKYVIAKTYSS